MDRNMPAALRRAADLVEDLLRKLYDGNLQGTPWSISVIREAAEKLELLAAYEATGLTPEICANYRAFEDEAVSKNVTFKRIVELMDADAEGRLLVLPCNDDAELVRDGETYRADHWNHTLTAFCDDPTTRSGKRVALFSIEEAEAALKGDADDSL